MVVLSPGAQGLPAKGADPAPDLASRVVDTAVTKGIRQALAKLGDRPPQPPGAGLLFLLPILSFVAFDAALLAGREWHMLLCFVLDLVQEALDEVALMRPELFSQLPPERQRPPHRMSPACGNCPRIWSTLR